MNQTLKTTLAVAVMALAIGRFGLSIYSGLIFSGMDFRASFYGQDVNDLVYDTSNGRGPLDPGSLTYLHGPTQHLTTLPLTYAGSFDTVARILLVVYGLLIPVTALVTWRVLATAQGRPVWWVPVFASTLAFPPLLEAYVEREFEIVITLAFALAYWAVVGNHRATLGALVAYVGFYKYMPLIAVPYLLIRRWWWSLAGFFIATALILTAAHALFGLDRFVNNKVPANAAHLLTSLSSTAAFCNGREDDDESVREDLCQLREYLPVPAPVLYVVILAVTLAVAAYGFVRLARAPGVLAESTERWRCVFELSLIVVVATTFFYSHFYYLAVLILPLNALLARFLDEQTWSRIGLIWWGLAYTLLGAFLIPNFLADRLLGTSAWALHVGLPRLMGEMILLSLTLHQYATLPLERGDRLGQHAPSP